MSKSINRSSRLFEVDGIKIYAGFQKDAPSYIKPWITQFCSLPSNEWFANIDEVWAGDWFNQYGIKDYFDRFDDAVQLMTNSKSKDWNFFNEEEIHKINGQACKIYGMLHARWICQPRGMEQMKSKYDNGVFGQCPRTSCNGCKVLPVGTTFSLKRHSVKLFCPKCNDIYRSPPQPVIDGAYFGPAFPHMFLYEYTEYNLSHQFKPFIQKAFGFRIRIPQGSRPLPHNRNDYEEQMLSK